MRPSRLLCETIKASGMMLTTCQRGCCRAAASVVCVHPQLPEDVCRMLGIPPLQEVVSETVDTRQPLVYLDALAVISGSHFLLTCRD